MRSSARVVQHDGEMTEAEIGRLVRAYEWGCGFEELQERFRRSHNSLRAILRARGVKIRPRHEARTASYYR